MSPLARLILTAMRYGAYFCATFAAAVIGLQIYNHAGGAEWTRQDISFAAVLVIVLGGALWFARSVARELR